MPTPTYIALANTTVAVAATTITFSSIPATYRDLILVGAATPSASTNVLIRVNGDANGNYSYVYMLGFSGGTLSGSASGQTSGFADTFTGGSNFRIEFLDYSATDKHKTFLSRSNGNTTQVNAYANRYALNDAITSVSVTASGQTFSTGSTFALYGIAS
jgi:hypothetical protein